MSLLEQQLRSALATAVFEWARADEIARDRAAMVAQLRMLVDRSGSASAALADLPSVVDPTSPLPGDADPAPPCEASTDLPILSAEGSASGPEIVEPPEPHGDGGDGDGSGVVDNRAHGSASSPAARRVLRCPWPGCEFVTSRSQALSMHSKKHQRAQATVVVADELLASPEVLAPAVVDVSLLPDLTNGLFTNEVLAWLAAYVATLDGVSAPLVAAAAAQRLNCSSGVVVSLLRRCDERGLLARSAA